MKQMELNSVNIETFNLHWAFFSFPAALPICSDASLADKRKFWNAVESEELPLNHIQVY